MNVTGTNGANRLVGSATADRISGLGGNDTILAGSGSDVADGGSGNDRVSGGEGADRLTGGLGDDVLFGYGASDVSAGSADIRVTEVGRGFAQLVAGVAAPGDPDRLYVVEQHTGRVMLLDPATGASVPFLDLPDASLATGAEQGVLGLAFDPDYATNGRFYMTLTRADGDIELRS